MLGLLPIVLGAGTVHGIGGDTCTVPRVAIADGDGVAAALASSGFVVLTNLTTDADPAWDEVTLSLPGRIFPGRLLSSGAKTLHAVHEENAKMAEQFKARRVACAAQGDCAESDWSDSFTTAGSPLLPHTDGYVYGDHLPDMIFLLSEHEAEQGGANFVVDGEAVLRRLRADAATAPLIGLAHTAAVDLTERLEAGGITTGREAFGPVFRRTADGTLWWRRQLQSSAYEQGIEQPSDGAPATIKSGAVPQPYQSLWAPPANASAEAAEGRARVEEMLRAVDAAIQAEARDAARFLLRRGEALLVDNYRILHGREGYTSTRAERRTWRVWCWTDRSSGPAGAEVGSPLEADALL